MKIFFLFSGDRQVLFLVMVTGCVSIGKLCDSEVFKVTSTSFIALSGQTVDEERIQEVRKLLNSGTFYFSWSHSGEPFDLSNCAQRKKNASQTDNRFFWYENMQTWTVELSNQDIF
jgi:synaptojanin